MLKLEVTRARARVRGRFYGRGSVLAETVDAGCEGVTAELEIESAEAPEAIAKLARVSEAGCFVIQSLRKPAPVSLRVTLNGEGIALARPDDR